MKGEIMKKNLSILLLTLIPIAVQAELCPSTSISAPSTTPSARFDFQQESLVVVDKQTGLKWARCAFGYSWDEVNRSCEQNESAKLTWTEALIFVKDNPVYLGEQGWRLPNIKELASIIEYKCYNPAINNDVFPGTVSDVFWSNTHVSGDISDNGGASVRVVNFAGGEVGSNSRGTSNYLRLVKDADATN